MIFNAGWSWMITDNSVRGENTACDKVSGNRWRKSRIKMVVQTAIQSLLSGQRRLPHPTWISVGVP